MTTINNYNLYRATATEKYEALAMIRRAGATVTGVSGCGEGYYIQLTATPEQASELDRMIFEAQRKEVARA